MRVYSWDEFHNQIECNRRLPNAHFGITRREAGTTLAPHAHEGASFICLFEGRHQWHGTDGLIRWTIPGAWYYRPPKQIHSHEACPTPIRCVGVNFQPESFGNPTIGDPGATLDHDLGHHIAARMRSELMEPTPGGAFLLQGLMLELIGLFVSFAEKGRMEPDHQIVRLAARLLDERFSEPLNLESLSDEIGVHRSHLARLFRKHLGVTVGEYLRDRRLEWAFRQLTTTDTKIAHLAVVAGFSDHAHFCRLFKGRFGLSPSAYRHKGLDFSVAAKVTS